MGEGKSADLFFSAPPDNIVKTKDGEMLLLREIVSFQKDSMLTHFYTDGLFRILQLF
jgi:hypothetical protein